MNGRSGEAAVRAVVIGAGGGIGAALVAALIDGGHEVHAWSRAGTAPPGASAARVDITDARTIAAAAAGLDVIDLAIVATGALHLGGRMPERALGDLDAAALARSFAVNAIGPALAFRHLAPLLPRDRRGVLAALSARVGSIGDNRSGGWYGYRASKAALNQIVRTAAIELARSRPQALCLALHPCTVDTAMSRPFQRGVPADRLFAPDRAARALLDVVAGLTPADSGGCFAWDGSRIAP